MLQLFTWIWWLQYFIYICADYLYSEIDGNLKGTEIKFTIQIKQSYGIILYGIDVWNDSLLINIREVNNNNIELIFNINENEGKDNIMSLCNCSKCFDESFYFEFDFSDINDSKQSIQIKCNRKISKLLMQHNSKVQWTSYPRPDNISSHKNLTFIWMGNIGPYVSNMNKSYPPKKEQIIGCLENFHFNNKPVTFKTNGTKIVSFCSRINYTETVYNFTNCDHRTQPDCQISIYTNRTVWVWNNCKSWTANYSCKGDLLPYTKQNKSFIVKGSQNHSFTIQLTWNSSFLKEPISLIQIILNDRSNISLYENNEKVFYIHHNHHPLQLMRFKGKSVKNLQWNFSKNEFALSIIDGEKMSTFNGYSIGNVDKVNIGFSVPDGNYFTFEGLLRFTFDPPEIFQISKTKSNNYHTNSSKIMKFQIIIPIFVIISVICFISVFIINKKYKANIKKLNLMKKQNTENVSNFQIETDYFVITDDDEYGKVCDKNFEF